MHKFKNIKIIIQNRRKLHFYIVYYTKKKKQLKLIKKLEDKNVFNYLEHIVGMSVQ